MWFISVFLDIAKFAHFLRKNSDVSRNQEIYHVIYVFFGSSLGNLKLLSFNIEVYIWQILLRWTFLATPHPKAAPERPILNRLKDKAILIMWIIFNWIAQLNFAKEFFFVQTIKYLTLCNILVWSEQTNTENLKSGSYYVKP